MAKRRIKVEDLRRIKFVSDPQISPDGSNIAFVLSTADHDEDRYERHIWMAETNTGALYQFTYGQGGDTNPRWSPDCSKLLFLSRGREPDKKTQLYVIPLRGGEATLVAETEEGVGSPAWAPNGRDILFTSMVWTDEKPKDTDVKVVKRIRYKFNALGFFEGRRTHLFTVRQGRKPRQLTDGDYDVEYAEWSPEGNEIAFITSMEADADTSRVRDIYKMPAKGGNPERLTGGEHAIVSLSYSPDGETVAFIGYDRPDELAVDYDLYIMPSGGGEKRCLTGGFDRSLGMGVGSDLRVSIPNPGAVWRSDGKHIFFLTADTPHCNVYRLRVEGGDVETVIGGRVVDGFSVSKDGLKIAFTAMSATRPCELYLLDVEEKRLSKFNDRLLNGLELVEPESFKFTNRLGREVEGWIIKPVGWEVGEKYPCVLEMHGGPRGVYGDGMF